MGVGDVKLRQLQAFGRYAIQVRSLVDRVAKGTDVAIAHIINENEDDVWPVRRFRLGFFVVRNIDKSRYAKDQDDYGLDSFDH